MVSVKKMHNLYLKKIFRVNPPTRGLRYKKTLFSLVQKNSFRNPVELPKIKYQTFTLIWNQNMSNYKIIETTKNLLR